MQPPFRDHHFSCRGRYKTGMDENGCVRAWDGRPGGGRSVAEADAGASVPRLAFFLRHGRWAVGGAVCGDEKKQLFHRLPPEFVRRILSEFNAGNLDAASAAAQLGIAKTRLYELRSAWLSRREAFRSMASGGAHRGAWPDNVRAFLAQFVPGQPAQFSTRGR